MSTFVADAFGIAHMPRINPEDRNYVSMADKLASLEAKLNLMSDAVSANTTRSIENSETMKGTHYRDAVVNHRGARPKYKQSVNTVRTNMLPPPSNIKPVAPPEVPVGLNQLM